MFELERQAIRRVFKLPYPTVRETFALAVVYIVQALFCTLLLFLIYRRANLVGEGWAVISAIIVLQPGLEASLAASIARICSNVIGAAVALTVGRFLGLEIWSVLVALVITATICELALLDMGLRAACVSVIIVMMLHEGPLVSSGIERASAVIVGSVVAVLVQIVGSRVKHVIVRRDNPPRG